jgi:hypothetical protein
MEWVMKRTAVFGPATVLAALLPACSSADEMSDAVGVGAEAQARSGEDPQASLTRRLAADAEPFAFEETEGEEETGTREFSYKWPRQVSAIPALAAQLDQKRAEELAQQKERWAAAMVDCPGEYVACRNDAFQLEWKVVADTPRFLSLSSDFYAYTGGAHGNYARSSLVWDREAEASLEPVQFFASASALDDALGEKACNLLNRERAKRRGGPVEPDPDDWANACVPMEDATIFLGSSTGERFDRIGIYYAPYVAGPYAEGEFEFTLPVTKPVLDAVRPEYREAFATK